ncbi:15-hydroxyprostaglandin dehydrogenase [NAD(+)]-like [Pogonomyrmex barbatus]|uniref:15-hydroxyprostaglandin dehydrogenase [NAD(+)]-like n=1 Tax=Pogonomyrmex barbatus TaxID=144034 RepID=A0A8N1S5Y1_9HYME|nr:15-hydroxyprostaglandin dehydrogenase [NAD(+)]-like [Pogonomyrmex barbatus]
MYNIHNKTAMITGAARGMGYKYAETLLRNGAKRIAIIDLPTSNGQNAAATLEKEFGKDRAIFIACDITKSEDLQKTFKEVVDTFEKLDILINNAGVIGNNWERTIDVNMKALIDSSFLAMDYMGKHKGGKGGVIVNVASVAALHPLSVLPVYTATKHGVLGFSQALADLYDKTGVRVLIMCPGYTETELGKNDRSCDFILNVLGNVDDEFKNYPKQSIEPVALAMLELIQKGKNGAAWVSQGGQPPYAVDFVHYSKRAVPV